MKICRLFFKRHHEAWYCLYSIIIVNLHETKALVGEKAKVLLSTKTSSWKTNLRKFVCVKHLLTSNHEVAFLWEEKKSNPEKFRNRKYSYVTLCAWLLTRTLVCSILLLACPLKCPLVVAIAVNFDHFLTDRWR